MSPTSPRFPHSYGTYDDAHRLYQACSHCGWKSESLSEERSPGRAAELHLEGIQHVKETHGDRPVETSTQFAHGTTVAFIEVCQAHACGWRSDILVVGSDGTDDEIYLKLRQLG